MMKIHKVHAERLETIKAMVSIGHARISRFECSKYEETTVEYGYGPTRGHAHVYYNSAAAAGIDCASYGDFREDATLDDFAELEDGADLYLMHRYTGFSDYSGCDVEAANYRTLKEEFYDCTENSEVVDVYGGHGTTDIAFSLRWLLCDESDSDADGAEDREDMRNELCDKLHGLSDYPLIDDQALCEVQTEYEDEAWESWARSDFVDAVEKQHGVDISDFDDTDLRKIFADCSERANEYWIFESGTSAWIDCNTIAGALECDDIDTLVVATPIVLQSAGTGAPLCPAELLYFGKLGDLSVTTDNDDYADVAVALEETLRAVCDDCFGNNEVIGVDDFEPDMFSVGDALYRWDYA